jgi:tetratricopeptide (TPR) repeat protein
MGTGVASGPLLVLLLLFLACGAPSSKPPAGRAAATPEQRRQSEELLQRGTQFLADNLLEEGAATLERAAQLDPGSVSVGLALARAYKLQSRYAASRKVLENLLGSLSGSDTDQRRVREFLVEVLLESGDLRAAQEACRPLLETPGASSESKRLAGMVSYRLGDAQAALASLQEAARLAPGDSQTHADFGLVLLESGDLDAAARELAEALRLDPQSQAAALNLAKAYERLGRSEDAVRAMEKYRQLYDLKSVKQKLGPLRKRGVEAFNAGRLDEALASFQEIVRISPRNAEALAQVGSVLLAMQRLDEARDSLEQSLRIKPDNDFALTELARERAMRNDLPQAIELLQKASRVNPSAPEPHYFLAGIFLAQGRRDDFQREKEAYLRLGGGASDSLRPLPEGGPP